MVQVRSARAGAIAGIAVMAALLVGCGAVSPTNPAGAAASASSGGSSRSGPAGRSANLAADLAEATGGPWTLTTVVDEPMTSASATAWAERNLSGLDGRCRTSAADAFGIPATGGAHAVRHYGSDLRPTDKIDISVVPVEHPARVLAWMTSFGKECGGLTTVTAETVAGHPAVLGEVPCDQGACYVLAVAGPEEIVQLAVTISYDSPLTIGAVRAAVAPVLGA